MLQATLNLLKESSNLAGINSLRDLCGWCLLETVRDDHARWSAMRPLKALREVSRCKSVEALVRGAHWVYRGKNLSCQVRCIHHTARCTLLQCQALADRSMSDHTVVFAVTVIPGWSIDQSYSANCE